MSAEQIGRKSVAFFFLTSLANVGCVILFAALCAVGLVGHDTDPGLTYGFGAAALLAVVLVLALPTVLAGTMGEPAVSTRRGQRVASVTRFAHDSLAKGIPDCWLLLRRRSLGVLIGSFGTMAFDLATLGVCFRAFGHVLPLGVLVLGYPHFPQLETVTSGVVARAAESGVARGSAAGSG